MPDARTCETRNTERVRHASPPEADRPQPPLPDWAELGARIQEAAMTRAIAAALAGTARRHAEEPLS